MAETSVIVRSFNEDEYVGDALEAVREQAYDDVEIVLVDSGSTDDTLEIATPLVDTVETIEPQNFTFGYALNVGCEAATGDYLAFLSAHAIPTDEHWLGRMVRHFEDETVAMVYSDQTGVETTAFPEQRHFDELFGEERRYQNPPEYFANNASSVVRADLWEEYRFDEHLTGCEDMDWAKHFMDQGYRVVYEPDSCIYHIHEESPTQVFTRFEREAIAHREIGVRSADERWWEYARLPRDVVGDLFAALKSGEFNAETARDVCVFRYNQRVGTATGLASDAALERDRYEFFYGGANRSVVVKGPDTTRLTEKPLPAVRPTDVLVRVEYAGVGPGDWEGEYPFVPGREYVGTVVDVGANVDSLAMGDTVVGEAVPNGDRRVGGSYVHFLSVPAERAALVPEGIEPRRALAAPTLGTVFDGLDRAGINGTPERVGVLGADAFGQLAATALDGATLFDPDGPPARTLLDGIAFEERYPDLSEFDLLVETPTARASDAVSFDDLSHGATLLALGDTPGGFEGRRDTPRRRTLVEADAPPPDALKRALQELPERRIVDATYPLSAYERAWDDLESGRALKPALAINGD